MKTGWKEVTFSEIFEISSSKRVLQEDWTSSGIPFYRAREIVKLAEIGSVQNELFITEELFDEYRRKYGAPQPGDLMISAVGTLGACYVVQPADRFYYKDASVLRFSPKVPLCSKFIQHAFRTREILDQVHAGSSSTVGTYTISRANETRLNLPPLAEQKRIAAVLDKADALRRKRQEALRLTDDFLRSTFLDLFGDPVTNPRGWPIVKASKLFADKPRLGTTRPATGKGYLVVRVGEIGAESVNFAKCGRVEQTPEELARFLLNKGDILVARAIGSRDQLGKCSYFDGHEELVANDSHVMRLRPDPAACNPYWFYFLLSSPAGRQLVQGKGGATAVPFNINGTQISDLDVPLPPVALQTQFVSLADQVRKTRVEQQSSQNQAETLFSALQQRAFSGDL